MAGLARRLGACAVLAACASMALGVPVAEAADKPPAFAPGQDGSVRKIQTGADGARYWTIKVIGQGPYVASWERRDGVWQSADQASKAAVAVSACQSDVYARFIGGLESFEAFQASPDVVSSGSAAEGTLRWQFTEGSAPLNEVMACMGEWARGRGSTTDAGGGVSEVRIPAGLVGPGEQTLFIVPLVSQPSDACGAVRDWPDGGQSMWPCPLKAGRVSTVTVTVLDPQPEATGTSAAVVVAPASDRSILAEQKPIYSSVGDVARDPQRVGAAAATAVVLAILVALPTALLDSTLESGTDLIGRLFRRRPRPGTKAGPDD